MKNVVISQSGGPTTVINNSIRGAIDELISSKKVDKIYGARMGILGILKEEFDFKVTLATGISKEICESVGLGYRNPDSIHRKDFIRPGKLWIENGGKYLYKMKDKKGLK